MSLFDIHEMGIIRMTNPQDHCENKKRTTHFWYILGITSLLDISHKHSHLKILGKLSRATQLLKQTLNMLKYPHWLTLRY